SNAVRVNLNVRRDFEYAERRKQLKDCANLWSCDDEVSRTTTVSDSDTVCFNNDFRIEVNTTLSEPTTVCKLWLPNRVTSSETSIEGNLDHTDDHFTVDFRLDFVGHCVCH